ncbi:MAG: hypothetical protein ACAH08_09490, partial [Methylophilus sp.]
MLSDKLGVLTGKFGQLKLSFQLGLLLSVLGAGLVAGFIHNTLVTGLIVCGMLIGALVVLGIRHTLGGEASEALAVAKSIADGDFADDSVDVIADDITVLNALNQAKQTLNGFGQQIAKVAA